MVTPGLRGVEVPPAAAGVHELGVLPPHGREGAAPARTAQADVLGLPHSRRVAAVRALQRLARIDRPGVGEIRSPLWKRLLIRGQRVFPAMT